MNIELNTFQRFLEPHVTVLADIWMILWAATALYVLYRLLREYVRKQ